MRVRTSTGDVAPPIYQLSWCTEDESEILGRGTYGVVFKGTIPATDKEPAEPIAVKRISSQNLTGEAFLKEIMTQHRANHPAILKIKGWYSDMPNQRHYVATELAPCGDLEGALEKERTGLSKECRLEDGTEVKWNETKKAICALGVAIGMAACHKRGITHRDLKPANVLLDKDMYPKICDFGMAKAGYNTNSENTVCGIMSPLWTPPEVSLGNSRYDPEKIDVYSYGIVLYELVTGLKPFGERGNLTIESLASLVTKGIRPSWENCDRYITDDIKGLIERCWDQDPANRPTFREIISDENRSIIMDAFENIEDYDEFENYEKMAMAAFRS